MFKFGENPPFGPPTPARVISVVGPEKDYYLKGRRSENQGLGIAAFAYYRRVVENQKRRIFEIIRVSQKIGASKEILDDLNDAKKENQLVRLLSTGMVRQPSARDSERYDYALALGPYGTPSTPRSRHLSAESVVSG